jgi:hypothetical protein
MTNISLQHSSDRPQSPFDSIRHFDEHGSEFWMARELQRMLGYAKWDKFEAVIQIGLENLACSVESLDGHSFPVEGTFGRTRQKGADYKLSRLACYHVTLACDSRDKPAVKAAKHYFAIKTREAEIAQPIAPPQPERQLPPPVTIHQYMEEARLWGLNDDPIIRSLISQRLAEELGSKALPVSAVATQAVLTVRAAELGYPHHRIGSGSQLGKFVARVISPTGKSQHGKYLVNVFDLNQELDDAIHAFFR